MLTPKSLLEYRSRLQSLLQKFEKARDSVSRDLTDSPNHPEESDAPDPSSTNSSDQRDHQPDQQVAVGSLLVEVHLADKIDAALQRLQNGQFGLCAQCGKAIDTNRLEIIPYARCCVDCERLEVPSI
ncbi:TraR/DksA family transcriptional regulator [Telmatocola sphagniphila]|uniref:TraR/DksA family transcriptional regulator n=1 Tax=Telmatocola sphagniphila TaxID=1123043 RepID=A0A8E6B8X3_9BACT|nr:TraR/DksA family transcriptional regulator [Telmatocola sphagniphila]QVL34047.1 TraR/DksA family transcriptional regulator [Telmatocola sphagniphila]